MLPGFLIPVIALAPALVVLLVDVARHEAHFRQEGVFFGLVAGIIAGFIAVVVEVFIAVGSQNLFVVLSAPFVEVMLLTMIVGLPRYRHKPAAIWYGGAAGLGLSGLLLLGQAQPAVDALRETGNMLRFALAAIGFTLIHYAAGMVAGFGAAKNRLIAIMPAGYLILVVGEVMMGELGGGRQTPFQGAALWAILLAVYGGLIWLGVSRRLHPQGFDPEAARAHRREIRQHMRE